MPLSFQKRGTDKGTSSWRKLWTLKVWSKLKRILYATENERKEKDKTINLEYRTIGM